MARVLLIGVGPTADTALESLLERFEVIGVVRNVGDNAQADPVIRRARSAGVPVFPDISRRSIQRLVSELSPDAAVVSSYSRLFERETVALCPFVNVHYGPLPKYRGMAALNWAILNGDPSTAITIHTIVEGMDSGRVLYQEPIPIGADDTVTDLIDCLNELQRRHLGDAVARLLDGDPGVAQDEAAATYSCNRMPQDGEIDWSASTRDVYALVLALPPPFPGAFTYLRGRRLIVWRATPVLDSPPYSGRVPGRVVAVSKTDGTVDVLTGDGVIRLQNVQLEGGAPVSPSALVTSVRTTFGLSRSELLERVEALEAQVAELTRALKQMTSHV